MSIVLAILAGLMLVGSLALLFFKEVLAPIAAYLGLVAMYFSELLPVNGNMLVTWLCLVLVVTAVTAMQPPAVMAQHRGMGYMTLGALAGMAVGLMGFTLSDTPAAVYAFMTIGVVAGVFFGYFLFTRTPDGTALRSGGKGRFFSYLLAKGFPAALTVMQTGVICILWISAYLSMTQL